MMDRRLRYAILCVLLVTAVVLLAVGLKDGGFELVLQKARMICYECIGLG